MTKVAVIGAGMCGISCANYLQKNGFGVTVFEKSRGIGGRMASRRINEQVSVDHGAQYIKPYSKNFLHFLEETVRAGFASSWYPLGMEKNYTQEKKIFVGTPRMNSILKNSFKNLEINFSSKINKILSNFNKWKLVIEGIEYQKEFDIVVFAIPFHQISEIIDDAWSAVKKISKVKMSPCWTLMLLTKNKLSFSGYEKLDNEKISSITFDTSKPQRNKKFNSYIIHSNPNWSERHISYDQNKIEEMLINILTKDFEQDLNIEFIKAHRWLYAQTTDPLGKPFIKNENNSLYAGGDWCLGANVESSFTRCFEIGKSIKSNCKNFHLE